MNKRGVVSILAMMVLFIIFSTKAYAEPAEIRYSPGGCPVWDSTDLSSEPIGEINGINKTFLLLEVVEEPDGQFALVRTEEGIEGYVPLWFCMMTEPLEPAVVEN